ncbi:MAG: Holliday junction resolvase RuvX [Actinomycetota bacterium]|nr:Holliday junction resolvase RuvX [Actinomycetota bacterium]
MDLGEAYSGVAISDPGGTLARPLEVMPSGRLEDRLRELFTEEAVAEVVIGVPKTLGGEVGFQAKWVLAKLDTLKSTFPTMRFVEWDERFTTRLAHSRERKGRRKGGKRERVDHLAAAGMLQEYLDRRGALGSAQRGT